MNEDLVKRLKAKNKSINVAYIVLIIFAIVWIGGTIIGGVYFMTVFGLLFFGFAFYGSIMKTKSRYKLIDLIKNSSAVVKKLKINDFQYFSDNAGKHRTTGYYIICKEGDKAYRSNPIGGNVFGNDLIQKDDFYEDYFINFDPNHREKMQKQIDDRIQQYEYEKQNAGFMDKFKIKSKISELKLKRREIDKRHLSVGNRNYYIGDELTIYVDPEDDENYYVDVD